MKKIEKHLIRSKFLYQKFGQSKVCDYFNRIGYSNYGVCKGCETETPIHKNSCLICGSHL
jgi:hypothetical protein